MRDMIFSSPIDKKTAYAKSSAALAYLGDAVIEVLVREMLVTDGKGRDYSARSHEFVTATAQSLAAERIQSVLSEDEADVFRRGKNLSHTNIPKSATGKQYCRATALECVFGYLYLSGDIPRVHELFALAYPSGEPPRA